MRRLIGENTLHFTHRILASVLIGGAIAFTFAPEAKSAVLLPSALAARFKAAGLDPNSKTFAADVSARIAMQHAALLRVRGPKLRRILPTTQAKIDFKKFAIARLPGLSKGGAPGSSTGVTPNAPSSTSATPAPVATPGAPFLSYNGLYSLPQITGVEPASTTQLLTGSPNVVYIDALANSSSLPEQNGLPYTIKVPACNLSVNFSDGQIVNQGQGPSPNTFNYWLVLQPNAQVLPIGAAAHPMTISYAADGFTVTSPQLSIQSSENDQQAFDVTIDETGKATDSGLDLPASSIKSSTVARVNPGATTMTGTDIIGFGVGVGAGYTAKAAVAAVSSVGDPPGDNAPCEQPYRCASVSVQPAGGRLETSVNWSIGPYESMQYVLEYTLTGAPGQRPATSMPLSGPCDS